MVREEVFQEILEYINDELETQGLNPYGATILPYIPSYEQARFPLIVMSQVEYALNQEALNKREKKHAIGLELNVFAIDTATVNKRTIANSVADLVESIIQDTYGLKLESSETIPNLQENVYRIVMRFTGLVDDDTKIIYREI